MPITPTKKIWMDGELVDWDDATIHILNPPCTTAGAFSRASGLTRPTAGRPFSG